MTTTVAFCLLESGTGKFGDVCYSLEPAFRDHREQYMMTLKQLNQIRITEVGVREHVPSTTYLVREITVIDISKSFRDTCCLHYIVFYQLLV